MLETPWFTTELGRTYFKVYAPHICNKFQEFLKLDELVSFRLPLSTLLAVL